jgi:hypothetical protein
LCAEDREKGLGVKKDINQHPIPFSDGMMVNGIYGMARKNNE